MVDLDEVDVRWFRFQQEDQRVALTTDARSSAAAMNEGAKQLKKISAGVCKETAAALTFGNVVNYLYEVQHEN